MKRTKVWRWVCSIWAYLLLDLRLFFFWVRFKNWFTVKSKIPRSIQGYYNAGELQGAMARWLLRKDNWAGLRGGIPLPNVFEYRAKRGQNYDSDNAAYAAYAAEALHHLSSLRGGLIGGAIIDNISLITVLWTDAETGDFSGQTVCAFRYRQRKTNLWIWAWISNWNQCVIQWQGPHESTLDTAGQVAAEVCRQGGKKIGLRWALFPPSLSTVFEIHEL